MMYYQDDNSIVFKEKYDGTLINNDGYTIETVIGEDGQEVSQLKTADGNVVSEHDTKSLLRHGDKRVRIITYETLKGRPINGIKIGTHHLTPGTIFEASIAGKPKKVFTVESIMSNGPGSYCVITTEIDNDPESITYGMSVSFNIDWVTRIIKRVPGNPVFEMSDVNIEILGVMEKIKLRDSSMFGRFTNYPKAMKRLTQMGLVKTKKSHLGSETTIKRKEAIKFLRKNQHWLFTTIQESKEINESFYIFNCE